MKIRWNLSSSAASFFIGAALVQTACAGPSSGRAVAAQPPASMEHAYALLAAERPEEAAAEFEAVTRAEPENRRARVELAYLRIREKRWKEAVDMLDALIETDPADLRLRMERGYARQALGERGAAADEFTLVAREPGEFAGQAKAALAQLAAESSEEARGVRRDALLNEGYDDLRRGDKVEARAKFKDALLEDPSRTDVNKQLAYMSLGDGDLVDAVAQFEGAHHLAPLDYGTALELGYTYDSLHDEAGAERAFTAALPSPDPKVHDAAAASLKNIQGRTRPLYLDVYAAPYYTSRSSDKIAFLEASVGYRPRPSSAFSVYLGSRYTQDTLSHPGTVPEIYSDNYAWFGPGLRYQPDGFNANLSAEWGPAFNLIRSGEHPKNTETDGRVVLADYHFWQGPARTFAEAGGSVGYYSRYRDNGIGYLQLRGGIKAWDDGSSQLSVYAPANVYKDTNKDFFNNAVEVGVGLELQPWTAVNLKVRAEYLHGTYMGISGRDPNPYGPHYDDARVSIVYSAHFSHKSAPQDYTPIRRKGFSW